MRAVIITIALVACGVFAGVDLPAIVTREQPQRPKLSILIPAVVLLATLDALGQSQR
jgi:hypothetical protein